MVLSRGNAYHRRLVCGPYFHYSDTWQPVVNTATTIVTFLMVFLIQNTQNRDARAIHLKLDEIIRSIQPANNEMMNIEKLSDDELETLSKRFQAIRVACQARTRESAAESAQGTADQYPLISENVQSLRD
jgi:low affinity Fe/Cu permease